MVKLIILQLNNLSEIYYGKKMVFHRSFFFPVMKGLIGPNKKERQNERAYQAHLFQTETHEKDNIVPCIQRI